MAQAGTGDALWKWILGGIAAGAAVLGLLIGAYAIGYDRGQSSGSEASGVVPPIATLPTTTETTETPETTETQPETTTETTPSGDDLVARGEELWNSSGCAGCHSLDGAAGVGPTVKGLAGSTVTLDDGSQVTADTAYLERAIVDPDAQISEGYKPGIMSGAVASQKFDTRPDDVAALVAFIEAQS